MLHKWGPQPSRWKSQLVQMQYSGFFKLGSLFSPHIAFTPLDLNHQVLPSPETFITKNIREGKQTRTHSVKMQTVLGKNEIVLFLFIINDDLH